MMNPIYDFAKDILDSGKLEQEKQFRQHRNTNVYLHSIHVAACCLKIAECLPFPVDKRSLVRGALLHDYFLYDWHDGIRRWHGLTHPYTAARNAQRDFRMNAKEINMIKTHMFPLVPVPPVTIEGWILTFADKICAMSEFVNGANWKLARIE